MKYLLSLLSVVAFCLSLQAQPFTRQDTLRGSITPQRAWWDLTHYDLHVSVDPETKKISGRNVITFHTLRYGQVLQIDLQEPLYIQLVDYQGEAAEYRKDGYSYFIELPSPLPPGVVGQITVHYGGQPVEAKRPPWDGGFTWSKDDQGYPFVATSCQGLGASVWWPCKDHMYDEPDSMDIHVTAPQGLTDVSNGRLADITYLPDGRRTWHWTVKNPINNYGVNVNIGKYAHWSDTLHGEAGVLDLDYYVLEDDWDQARTQFQDVARTIRAFEYWFGPYPFYEDGYKLVQVPYLGMEHQSSVTYGNQFRPGYLGSDLSGTGWGLKWDFIIVHESAHEWWANSITYQDIADMWIHESFANYAESLFTDYYYGKEAAELYVQGTRRKILNDKPIIAAYGVNREGSSDMYYKGGNMLHSLRTWIDDDVKWRNLLRGLQSTFRHKTVTTQQIEDYMSEASGLDLKAFFDQYLRDTRVPVLEYKTSGKKLSYRYANVVAGFAMPVRVKINNEGTYTWLRPTTEWQDFEASSNIKDVRPDDNFYVMNRRINP